MNSRANFWQFSLPKLYFGLASFHLWMNSWFGWGYHAYACGGGLGCGLQLGLGLGLGPTSISSFRFVVVPTCPNRPTSAPTCDFFPWDTATFISVEFSS